MDELRQRYQSSLLLTLCCSDIDGARINELVQQYVCKEAKPMQDVMVGKSKTMTYELPGSVCSIRQAMRSMLEIKHEEGMEGLGWEVRESSLESIFIDIVRVSSSEESGI